MALDMAGSGAVEDRGAKCKMKDSVRAMSRRSTNQR